MSGAYLPTSVHSLPPVGASHFARPGSGHIGRDAGSFVYMDPMFDIKPTDKTVGFVPMSEEEFYRAKIRMKDG